jgi:hypothetical protein
MEQLNGFAALATILIAFGGGMLWIIRSIKTGQDEIKKGIMKDLKMTKKEIKKRRSIDECEKLRLQCPCNQIMKGKEK